ncbi:MAG: hypothetical protein AB7T49_14505 [Oligoflexales bacterium]
MYLELKRFLKSIAFTFAIHGIAYSSTLVRGTISDSQVWDQEHGPYLIEGNVFFTEGSSLTITEGTAVEFRTGSRVYLVDTTFEAKGTKTHPIIVRGEGKILMNDCHENDPGAICRQWNAGIDFRYIKMDSVRLYYTSSNLGRVQIDNSLIKAFDCEYCGTISGEGPSSRISSSQFSYLHLARPNISLENVTANVINLGGKVYAKNLTCNSLRTNHEDLILTNSRIETAVIVKGDLKNNEFGTLDLTWSNSTVAEYNVIGTLIVDNLAETDRLVVTNNNIGDQLEGGHALRVGSDYTDSKNVFLVSFPSNYWGSDITAKLIEHGADQNFPEVWDRRDDIANYAVVDLSDWLSAPVPEAGPRP